MVGLTVFAVISAQSEGGGGISPPQLLPPCLQAPSIAVFDVAITLLGIAMLVTLVSAMGVFAARKRAGA